MLVTFREVGQAGELGTVVANPRQFKTGSTGFFGVDKLNVNGKRYQVQVQLVEIGSKAANATPDVAPYKAPTPQELFQADKSSVKKEKKA